MKLLGTLAFALVMATACVSDGPGGALGGLVVESAMPPAKSSAYVMTSAHTGREYVIRVSAPMTPLAPGERAPIVYVTDGNWYFGMATEIVRLDEMQALIGPAYVVAIGYPDTEVKDIVAKRAIDLVHTRARGPHGMMGSDGAAFLDFLTDELRPFVEARTLADPERAVLAGQSLGGLFAANVLLHEPEAFSGYLIGSPSVWADKALLETARGFTAGTGQRVFVGVGGAEAPNMVEGAADLAAALSAPSTGLRVEHGELATLTHTSMLGAWFAKGLHYVLPRDGVAG